MSFSFTVRILVLCFILPLKLKATKALNHKAAIVNFAVSLNNESLFIMLFFIFILFKPADCITK